MMNKKFIIPFFKMHGLGNDYIYIDLSLLNSKSRKEILENKIDIVQSLSKYHYGIGSDGLIYIDFKKDFYEIEMYNKDGSYSQICGNGFRCIGGYLYLNNRAKDHFFILSGSKKIEIRIENDVNKKDFNQFDFSEFKVWVNMGQPNLLNPISNEESLRVGKYVFNYRYIDIGNPHCVIFLKQDEVLEDLDLNDLGPQIEKIFQQNGFIDGINIEWVKVLSKDSIIQRTWERGSGETLACGSGASASFMNGILLKMLSNKITCKLLGGNIYLSLEEGNIWQTGEIKYVFNGYYFYDSKNR